jgi:putative sigma-54 modulation protein
MIPIEVRSKTYDMESLIRQFVERRISFALDHLRDLRRITISIEDVNGPKGGADKHCQILAEFAFTSLVLEETQPDWQTAIARAIHRLDRKATQELKRVNQSGSHSAHRTRVRTSRAPVGSDN